MNEAENNPKRGVLKGTFPSLRKHKPGRGGAGEWGDGISCSRQSWVPAYTITAIWHTQRHCPLPAQNSNWKLSWAAGPTAPSPADIHLMGPMCREP